MPPEPRMLVRHQLIFATGLLTTVVDDNTTVVRNQRHDRWQMGREYGGPCGHRIPTRLRCPHSVYRRDVV
jgi:hypothetical protein